MLGTLLPPFSWIARRWVDWRVSRLCARGAGLLGVGKWEAARDVFQLAVDWGRWIGLDYVQALFGLSASLGALGDVEAATKVAVSCVSAADSTLPLDAPDRRWSELNLAQLYEAQGRYRGAVGVRERLVRLSERHGTDAQRCEDLLSLSRAQLQLGDLSAARQTAELALDLAAQASLDVSDGERCLGTVALCAGKVDEAIVRFEQVEARRSLLASSLPYRDPPRGGDAVDAYNLASGYVAANRLDDAERWCATLVRRRGDDASLKPLETALMGELRRRQGRLEEAALLLREGIGALSRDLSPSHWRVARARLDLAKTLSDSGDPQGAAAEGRRAVEALDPQVHDSHPLLARARALAAGRDPARGL